MRILRKTLEKSKTLFFRITALLKSFILSFAERINVSLLLCFLFIANILDALLTLKWLELQVADEANPLMALLIDISPSLFLSVKVIAIFIACIILWKARDHLLAKLSTALGASVYYIILLYHFFGALKEGILVMPTKERIVLAIQEWSTFMFDWLTSLGF